MAGFDLGEVFSQAETAKGTSLLTDHELELLLDYARGLGEDIHTIEAWELRDGKEIARPDFNFYGPDEETPYRGVQTLLTYARVEQSRLAFQVWI